MGACGSSVRSLENQPNLPKASKDMQTVIVKSPYVNSAPLVPLQSIWSFLNERIQHVAMNDDKEWLRDVSTGDALRYSELEPLVRSVANALHKRGFSPGDTLLFTTSNCSFFYVIVLGVWRLNGIVRASYPEDSADTLLIRLMESEAKFILCDKETASRALVASQGTHWDVYIFAFGEVDGCTPVEELLQDDCDGFPGDAIVNPESDPIYIPITSGTTGISKGPVHSHFSLISCFIQGLLLPSQSNGKHLVCSRMQHFSGFLWPLMALLRGERVVTMSKPDPILAFQAIQDHKPSSLVGVITFLLSMARDHIRPKCDLSSLLTIVTGGSPVTVEEEDELYKSFPTLKAVYIYYGMAECFIVSSNVPFYISEQWTIPDKAAGSIGLLLPYVQAQVQHQNFHVNRYKGTDWISRHVDHGEEMIVGLTFRKFPYQTHVVGLIDGHPLGPNEKGEICIQSPTMMTGYWKRLDVTAKMIRDGWLHTGDYGYFNENGFLFITDSIKEVFKHWGNFVSPSELEGMVAQHDAVKEVAVIGIPDEAAGSLARAYVVLRPNANGVTPRAIQNYVTSRATSQWHQLGGGVVLLDELQRNKMGGINKEELRALAEEEVLAQMANAADPEKRN